MSDRRGRPALWFAPLVRLALAAALMLALVAWLRRSFQRFEVSGDSMEPAYREGDFLLARRLAPGQLPHRGDVVLALDPRFPSRVLLKRVAGIDLHGQVTLHGDNASASTDSRDFGPVRAEAVIARVIWRYWPVTR